MGYNVNQIDSEFFMSGLNLEAHFETTKGEWAEYLEDWEVVRDEHGDVTALLLEGDRLPGDLEKFLKGLAPYVKPGSYLAFIGEDQWIFRYLFKEGTFYEQSGKVAWQE